MIKLSNYKIIKKIGSGGMGDVYLGEHTVLENKVAIKSLHSPLVKDEDFRKRFRKEAKTQWKLSHPNIVKLIDFQEQKDGLFLIMEYVEGKQLNDYIRDDSGPIPEDKLIPLFIQIISAINHAHNKGLVHRDIKPANVLITPSGDAKVLDFGIAKQSTEDSGLTKTGVQVGTVSYMSPEQVRAEKVDKLSDIYSLGVTLFQMAVGKAPYAGQTNQFNIQLDIVSNPFPKARSHYPSVSDKIEAIIEKATQKKKSDRFQSCEDFIKSLEASSKVVKQTLAVNKENKTKKKDTSKSKTEKKPIKVKDPTEKLKVDEKIEEKSGSWNTALFIGLSLLLIVGIFYVNIENDKKYRLEQDKEKTESLKKQARDERLRKERQAQSDSLHKIFLATKKAEKEKEERLDKERERKQRLARQAAAKKEKERKVKLARQAEAKKERERKERIADEKAYKRETYDNGDYYYGQFKNGKRHGQGTYTWKNGNKYVGAWLNGVQHGQGTKTNSDGEKYVGAWVNEKKQGKGKEFYVGKFAGHKFEGEFFASKKHGQGTYTWKSGAYETGNYINGKESGLFLYYKDKYSKSKKRRYKNGKCKTGC